MMEHLVHVIDYKHNTELADALDRLSDNGWELVTVTSDKYNDFWGSFSATVILRRPLP